MEVSALVVLLGKTVADFAGLFDSGTSSSLVIQLLHLFGNTLADMAAEGVSATENISINNTEGYLQEADDRTGLSTPVFMVTMVPLLAKAMGIFIAVTFQYAVKGILITIKSYMIRTILLGLFFFVMIPLGKLSLIKAGLLAMSPAILSRSGNVNEDPYDTPSMESFQGIVETFIWEIFRLGESFYGGIGDIDELILS